MQIGWGQLGANLLRLGLLLALCLTPVTASATSRYVEIGTGGVKGVYYPAGAAIARVVNKTRPEHGIRITIQATDGSVANVNGVMAGDFEFGIVQSDRQYQAAHGLAEWKDIGSQDALRSVCSLYTEAITLMATAESGILTFADLAGKVVNIGEPGSGQYQNAVDVLNAVGMDIHHDITPEYKNTASAPKLLQDGRIDAFFYTVGHPNKAIQEAISGRVKVRFIPLDNPKIQQSMEELPYYTQTVIPIGLYPDAANTEDVSTYGVKATFVTSLDVSDDVVYTVTKEIFENLDDLKALHPALNGLRQEDMLKGLSAPIHPGALKYYQETGLRRLIPVALR